MFPSMVSKTYSALQESEDLEESEDNDELNSRIFEKRRLSAQNQNTRILKILFFSSFFANVLMVGAWFIPRIFTPSADRDPSIAFFGKLPFVPVTFGYNATFAVSNPAKKGTIWDEMIPVGRGFVEVPKPSQFGLEGGFPVVNSTFDSEVFDVSMFHQLHCLAAIKSSYMAQIAKTTSDVAKPGHIRHCFEYLRQGIMCSADLTLEKAVFKDGKKIQGADGKDVVHFCKSWDAIFDFMTIHAPNNKTGII